MLLHEIITYGNIQPSTDPSEILRSSAESVSSVNMPSDSSLATLQQAAIKALSEFTVDDDENVTKFIKTIETLRALESLLIYAIT
jgi:hypothetical protein